MIVRVHSLHYRLTPQCDGMVVEHAMAIPLPTAAELSNVPPPDPLPSRTQSAPDVMSSQETHASKPPTLWRDEAEQEEMKQPAHEPAAAASAAAAASSSRSSAQKELPVTVSELKFVSPREREPLAVRIATIHHSPSNACTPLVALQDLANVIWHRHSGMVADLAKFKAQFKKGKWAQRMQSAAAPASRAHESFFSC